MRLTYLDESGSSDGTHYIFGALVCDISQAKSIETRMEQLGATLSQKYPETILPSTEFHAVEIRHGKGFWRHITMEDRFEVLREVVDAVESANPQFVTRSINIPAYKSRYGENAFPVHQQAMGYILEQVEHQMARFFSDELTVLFADEHHSAPDARANLRRAKSSAVRGKISVPLTHIFDTVYFGPSDYSRPLQAVDICTYFYMQSRFSSPAKDPWARSQIEGICEVVDRFLQFEYEWPS